MSRGNYLGGRARAAARLSASTATVYKLCAAGKLVLIRVLGAIRVSPVHLAAFIEHLSI